MKYDIWAKYYIWFQSHFNFPNNLIDCIKYQSNLSQNLIKQWLMGVKNSKHFDLSKLSADEKKKL